MSILKTAQDVRALRNAQRAMAIEGDHVGAWKLSPKVREHMWDLADNYVGATVKDNPIGRLIMELACEAALAAPDLPHDSDLKVALRTANRMAEHAPSKWYTVLRRARRQMPNIEQVTAILMRARSRNNITK